MSVSVVVESYSLSAMQQAMLLNTQLAPQSGVDILQLVLRLRETLDVPLLVEALRRAIERHAIFRTAFRVQDLEEPRQEVYAAVDLPFEEHGPAGLPADGVEAQLAAYLETDRLRGFDASHAPLHRVALLHANELDHHLIWSFHHAIVDGRSLLTVVTELIDSYDALRRGEEPRLPPCRPYRDYIEWLRLQDPARSRAFWEKELEGFAAPTPLPLARSAGRDLGRAGYGSRDLDLSKAEMASLKSLCAAERLTLGTLLHGAWALVLGRFSGEADVVFGATRACRRTALGGEDTATIVGPMFNTLPLRARIDRDAPLFDWLRELRARGRAIGDHEHTPLLLVKEWSGVAPGLPLFESLLSYEERLLDSKLVPRNASRQYFNGPSFPLMLSGYGGDELRLRVTYQRARYDEASVDKLLGHVAALLAGIAAAKPARRVGELSMLTEKERRTLIVEWNDTAADYPREAGVHTLIEAQVDRTPDAVAVSFEGTRLTYRELDERANQLARLLQRKGVGLETPVGLYVERSLDLVIATLAVLKAGGAYVPLDPDYPPARLGWMLENSGARVVVTSSELPAELALAEASVVRLDLGEATLAGASPERLESLGGGERLAYVLYTSGSTGAPKGVEIPHRAVVNFLESMRRRPGFAAADRLLAVTSFSFDIAGLELFLPLVTGAQVEIASRALATDGARLADRIARSGITVMQATPSTWWLLLEAGWTGGEGFRALVGGEAVPAELAVQLVVRAGSVWNMYGPTETTIWSCVHPLRAPLGQVSVGRPIANTRVFVLDDRLALLPIGAAGQVYIGGDGLGRGYRGRPDLTAERFIPDPFDETGKGRLYATGDLGRWRQDGALEILGRIDHQVKIRGYRIELGEIEAVLAEHPRVSQAIVTASGDRLAAYVVARDPRAAPSPAELRLHLEQKLPAYMIPAAFVALPAFPLLPNGKVDRRALPSPDLAPRPAGERAAGPKSAVEATLLAIWEELLPARPIEVDDDFFALGGHSLLAARAILRVRRALGVEIPLDAFFQAPSLRALARRIEAAPIAGALPALGPRPEGAPPSLSFAQERLLFLELFRPGTAVHHIPAAMRLQGPLDLQALGGALAAIARRHEVLRTSILMTERGPELVVRPEAAALLSVEDLRATPGEDRERALRRVIEEHARRPFDLRKDPLLRAALVTLDRRDHALLLVLHHIASDAWSMGVVLRELGALYGALTSAAPGPPLPPPPIQYADFALWQRRVVEAAIEPQIAYWKRELAGAPALIDLPLDHPRPAVQTVRGGAVSTTFPPRLAAALHELGHRAGATLFMTLLAGLWALLHRVTGQDDLSVGSPVAGRTHLETEPLVGFFVSTVVLRVKIEDDPTFLTLMEKARATSLGAQAHQDVPFDRLVEALKPERSTGHAPLFQVMLVLHNAPRRPLDLAGVVSERIDVDVGAVELDLALYVREDEGGLRARLEYNADLFERATAERLLGHLVTLLEGAAARPDAPVSTLPILSPAEHARIVSELNRTEAGYPRDACVHDLFFQQASRTPEAIAIDFAGRTIRYDTLAARAGAIARRLAALDAGPGALVGVLLDRSSDLVAALLGVLASGAAYVPLDPDHPAERVAFVLDDAGASIVITERRLAASMPAGAHVLVLDLDDGAEPAPDVALRPADPSDLAYVIYTSGSTGRPKGVPIGHRSVVNFLTSMAREPGLSARDALVAITTIAFDIAGLELYLPLSIGGRVILADRVTATDGAELRALIERSGATVLQATPASFRLLADAGFQGGSGFTALSGGDTLPPELAGELLQRAGAVYNLFGPTETTIWSTIHRVTDATGPIPIGRPIANTRAYVLDRHLAPIPFGVAGELCIGGDGLSPGYLGRPELTAERFVPDPFVPGERIYRTGDRARMRPDGVLEHLGRLDFQIKIRGYRIEPGEIEARLLAHPSIREAVVVAREDRPGDARLVAYVVARGALPTFGELRVYLAASLPEYMVPSSFVVLDALPLTPNGKLDRRALPAPSGEGHGDPHTFAVPVDPLEADLVTLWESLIGVHPIGTRDDFFELGGHSMLAARLFDRIEAKTGRRLPLATLFSAPTIERLAGLLRKEGWSPSWDSLVAIQTEGSKPPFFCVHAIGGNVLSYRTLSLLLGKDQPFYGLQALGLDGRTAPPSSVEDMAARYLREIRSVQPHGPYRLGGSSSGGVVAFEMAQQLRASSEEVALLALMDTVIVGVTPSAASMHRRIYAADLHVGQLLLRPSRDWPGYMAGRLRARIDGYADKLARALGLPPRSESASFALATVRDRAIMRAYVPKPYAGPITLLVSRDEPNRTALDPRLLWADVAMNGLTIHFVPGLHDTLLDEPTVTHLAAFLAECLRRCSSG